MNRLTRFFTAFIFFLLCIGVCGIAEEITLTTYYPAPYGAYDELSANRLEVEDGAVIGATYIGTAIAPANGLVVEGNVGIGTVTPTEKLDVNGTINAIDYEVNGTAGWSGWFDDGVNYRVTVTNGIITNVTNSIGAGHNP